MLDDIEAALAEHRFSSRTAAIKANIKRLEGPTEDSIVRRLIRKLEKREEERAGQGSFERGLADFLATMETTQERVRWVAEWQRLEVEVPGLMASLAAQLRARGVDVASETGRSMLKALVLAEIKNKGKKW